MILGVTAVLLTLLAFIVSFLFLYKNRQQQYRRNMDAATEHFNQEILKAQLEIKEQTLKNVSQEIHDNVGQVLSLAVLHLSAVDVTDTAGATDKIENVTGLVQKAVADLRNLSKTMDADNITVVGLAAMIRFELDLLEKTTVYTTSLEITGEEQRLDVRRELILYRIVQESFSNVMKHAKASAIMVRLDYSTEVLALRISDNGRGFDTAVLYNARIDQRGAGIKNMHSRAVLIGAEFGIQSSASGTDVCILIKY